MTVAARMQQLCSKHWFFVLLPMLIGAALVLTRMIHWQSEGRIAEAVLLFDCCVTLPVLYGLCYFRTKTAKQLAIRMLAIACLGVVLAGWLVPESEQRLIEQVGWLRLVGIAVLLLIELRIVVAAVRIAFGTDARPEELAAKTDMPLPLARLMALEARFWKAVWRVIRGRK